jgi:hypothetical protein
MVTVHDQQEPLWLLPPDPPTTKRKFAPWHIVTLVVGVPILATLSAIGANTVAHHFIDVPAARASANTAHKASARPTRTAPQYDLAQYRSVLNGSDAQRFVDSLARLRTDVVRSNFTQAVGDAPRLINAADTWLADLKGTHPPPSFNASKLEYMAATVQARKAGQTIQQALQSTNFGLMQQGADQIGRARSLLRQANAPHATGS